MKYNDKYPDAKLGIKVSLNLVVTLHEEQARPCVVCKEETRWFHRDIIIFHICSEECLEQYLRAN